MFGQTLLICPESGGVHANCLPYPRIPGFPDPPIPRFPDWPIKSQCLHISFPDTHRFPSDFAPISTLPMPFLGRCPDVHLSICPSASFNWKQCRPGPEKCNYFHAGESLSRSKNDLDILLSTFWFLGQQLSAGHGIVFLIKVALQELAKERWKTRGHIWHFSVLKWGEFGQNSDKWKRRGFITSSTSFENPYLWVEIVDDRIFWFKILYIRLHKYTV